MKNNSSCWVPRFIGVKKLDELKFGYGPIYGIFECVSFGRNEPTKGKTYYGKKGGSYARKGVAEGVDENAISDCATMGRKSMGDSYCFSNGYVSGLT